MPETYYVVPEKTHNHLVEVAYRHRGYTADEAADRFERAVEQVVSANPQGNIAIVSHGTVIALLLERQGAGIGRAPPGASGNPTPCPRRVSRASWRWWMTRSMSRGCCSRVWNWSRT